MSAATDAAKSSASSGQDVREALARAQVTGLFPTPFVRIPALLDAGLVAGLVAHFSAQANQANSSSDALSHTRLLQPGDSPLLVEVAGRVTPALVEFGALLFGERMAWAIKEMWVNVMEHGGRQAVHNHANSFISGVLYLSAVHAQSCTVFVKPGAGTGFAFHNEHAGTSGGPYNAEKWISPQPEPGDLALFPSYLLHEVPPNAGERRITLPFNAIPARLDSWGYRISFGA